MPILPPAPDDQPRPALNRIFGATSGPYDGNVRAILAILATIGLHGIFVLLLQDYVQAGAHDLQTFVVAWGTATFGWDGACMTWYFAKRAVGS